VPAVLIKGLRAAHEEQLPMALVHAASDEKPPNSSAVQAVVT